MTTLRIREANSDDADFLAAGNVAMALETEGKALDADIVGRGVRRVLQEPARGFYLVAEDGEGAVGQLMVTYEWSDWRDGDFFWIQSVFVVEGARRRGVFTALYREVERRAAAAGAVGIRLYVERDNARAQETYRKLGMAACDYLMFETR